MTQKINQSNDGLIILETWKQMAKLLHLDVRIDSMVLGDDEDDAIMDSQFQSSKEPEIKKELLKEYKNYFEENEETLSAKQFRNEKKKVVEYKPEKFGCLGLVFGYKLEK